MKRSFNDIRVSIMLASRGSPKTINEISKNSSINWRTVSKHLQVLKESELVEEVFNSPYVRIFQLSEKGRNVVK